MDLQVSFSTIRVDFGPSAKGLDPVCGVLK